jgi:hypothetical protein
VTVTDAKVEEYDHHWELHDEFDQDDVHHAMVAADKYLAHIAKKQEEAKEVS